MSVATEQIKRIETPPESIVSDTYRMIRLAQEQRARLVYG